MNVIDLLEADHRLVEDLFTRYRNLHHPEGREEIAEEIIHELSVHAAVEEIFVYPLVRRSLDDGEDVADHAIEEHQKVKELLKDLEKREADSVEHIKVMNDVIDSTRHHISEEESDMLARLRQRCDQDTLEEMGAAVESAKKVVPTRPHPLVPGTATAQLIAGPWASLVDRARDLVDR